MHREDIINLEKYINFLEKESKKLEESYSGRNQKKFNVSKKSIIRIQEKINEVIK